MKRLACYLAVLGLVAHPFAAGHPSKRLSISDTAPAISFSSWIKGTRINQFQPGTIYVVDFWATWCGPCNRGMPHLSEIAKKYAGKVQVIGVDVRENDHNQVKPGKDLDAMVSTFVQGKGDAMNYNVCTDSVDKFMMTNWMTASGEHGIPCAFVIDGTGKIAEIVLGYGPGDTRLDDTIKQLLGGTFDYQAAAKRHSDELGSK